MYVHVRTHDHMHCVLYVRYLLSLAHGMAAFAGLDAYKLVNVLVTDRELGHGSYATVFELEYMGLKCAGKKIHDVLLKQGETTYIVRRFEEECRILSQMRHPNVVQFLGVYFQEGLQPPILVMEFLPTNLTSCIEKYSIIHEEIVYSILHDVALGLCYLHSQSPPIVHRDLSSNNILLATNMSAKISDLGVARILNLTPLQVSRMTQVPGTPAYMPPEVMVAKPKYNTSVDKFSYGILMIHVLSGEWPVPQVGQIHTEGTKMIPVSEAERRQEFLNKIGNDHPLMSLILDCISNIPEKRTHADQIVKQLAEMVYQFPASYANQLEMLQDIETKEADKRALREAGMRNAREVQQMERQVLTTKEEMRAELKQKLEEIDQLKQAHSTEMEQLQLVIENLNSQVAVLSAEKEVALRDIDIAKGEHERWISEVKKNKEIISGQTKSFELSLEKVRGEYTLRLGEFEERLQSEKQRLNEMLAEERKTYETLLTEERKLSNKLTDEKVELLAELATTNSQLESLKSSNTSLKGEVAARDAVIECNTTEIEAKTKALQERDTIISGINEQLTKIRKYLANKTQVSNPE